MSSRDSSQGPSRWAFNVSELVTLVAASFFSPLMVWANSGEAAPLSGFGLLATAVFLISLAIRSAAVALHLDPLGSTYATAAFVLVFSNAGLVLDRGVGRWVVIVGGLAIAAIAYRLRRLSVFRSIVTWGVIVLLGYPWLVWFTSQGTAGPVTIDDPPAIAGAFEAEQRDIVVIVFDAYANNVVLRDLYEHDQTAFTTDLEQNGFQVVGDALANYGRTRFSVSSVMQLDYPVEEGPLTNTDLDHLLDVVGGDNHLARWLVESGYTHTYVESGWFGTICGENVQVCVEGPWPNESFYDFTNRTVLQGLPGFETGRSFSEGAVHALDWIIDDLPSLLANDRPDYVYVHVLAPHPPLFLDSECVMRPQEGVDGFTIAKPGMTESELAEARDWYVRQVDCVNGVISDVAVTASETDSIMIILGDHGPDSLGQLFVQGADWDADQRFERLSAFAAARVPQCDMADVSSLVNVGRRLVTCLSTQEYPDIETRTYESDTTEQGEVIVEIPVPAYEATG